MPSRPSREAKARAAAGELAIAHLAHAIAVVVDDERLVARGEILEEIDECVARHVEDIIQSAFRTRREEGLKNT